MRNSLALSKTPRAVAEYQHVATRSISWNAFLLSLTIFVLLAAPKIRIVVGNIPLYLVDGLIAVLLVSAYNRPGIKWQPLQPIPRIAGVYLIFVCLGELRGMIEYRVIFESIYMLVRFCLAISLLFTLPKLVTRFDDLKLILKGAVVGLLISSIIAIMYSLPPTRPLVMNTVFSMNFLCPESESLARKTLYYMGMSTAMRGRSLIGAATMTTGFLGSMWPLAFLAYRFPGLDRRWKWIALLTSIVVPLGILMTYGRTAWLIVALIGTMIGIFGFAGGRQTILITIIGCILLVHQYGPNSNLFRPSLIIERTKLTLNKPFEDQGTTERILSFVEPFKHIAKNPFWLVMGAGRTGERMTRRGNLLAQLYDEGGLATHSAFAMAYYCFGAPGSICQILLMLFGFRLILRRVKSPKRQKQEQVLIWQSLLMAWCGLALWWLSGHGMVGEPRGSMLFFFMYGLLLACERLQVLHDTEQPVLNHPA